MERGVFQETSLSAFLFILSMVPLLLILRVVSESYEWGMGEYKLNPLLLMDDLKLFFKR